MSVREHWINVRVNPEELARIREKQKELGIRNTGAYMRKMAMDSVFHVWDAEASLHHILIRKQESQSIMADLIRVL